MIAIIRTSILAAATIAFAAPAFAEMADAPKAAAPKAETTTAAPAAAQAQLNESAEARNARTHLIGQGYTNISTLQLDETGRWAGTAMKNGKIVIVAIHVPNAKAEGSKPAASTN